MKKIKRMMMGIGMASMLLLSGCQFGNKDIIVSKKLNNRQAFQIGSSVCSMTEAKVYLINYQNIYGTAYGIDLWDGNYGDISLEKYLKDVTISELSQVVCMDLLAKEQEITLSEKEKEQMKEAAKAYYETLNEEELSYTGVTESELAAYYEHYALAQKVYNSLTKGVNEEVSDDEARVMEAMQIYVTDSEKANLVKEKLEAGEDFATVANNYNEASSIELTIAREDLPEKVEKEVFRLDDNEISGMLEAENGYYFVKCLNKYNEELTEANKINIVQKREKEAFDDIYEAFIEKQSSALNQEAWESLEMDTTGKIKTNRFFEFYDTYSKKL